MKSKIAKLVGLIAAIITVVLMKPLLFPAIPEPGSGKEADSFCSNILAKKNHKEARQWLNEATKSDIRTIGEKNSSGSRNIVERLYNMGAVNVEAADIDRVTGYGETTNVLIVQLPDDPVKRKKLFSYEAKISSANGFDPTSDDGQKYMFLFKFTLPFFTAIFRTLGWGNEQQRT